MFLELFLLENAKITKTFYSMPLIPDFSTPVPRRPVACAVAVRRPPSITPAVVGSRLGVAVVRPRALCARSSAARSPVPSLCDGPLSITPAAVLPRLALPSSAFRLPVACAVAPRRPPSITPAVVGPRLGVAVVRPRALCARPPASRSPVPSLCGGPSVNHSPVAVCAGQSPGHQRPKI